jgi:hypothetical protein
MLIIILIISLVMLISHRASLSRGKPKRNSFPGSQAQPRHLHPAGQALIDMQATERMLPAPSEPGQARCREANAAFMRSWTGTIVGPPQRTCRLRYPLLML